VTSRVEKKKGRENLIEYGGLNEAVYDVTEPPTISDIPPNSITTL